jgi:hypothetical protein
MTELPDRLLRDALRPKAPEPTSNVCVDAETLAAWADGTMSESARAAFEIHAADCARCQALMAAMARIEPPPIDTAWWRRTHVSWLMPLAAATAAIVVVVSLTMTERRAPAPQVARNEPAAAATPPRVDDVAAPKTVAPSASAPAAGRAPASAIPESRRERAAIPPAAEPKRSTGLSAPKPESLAKGADQTAAPRPGLAAPSPSAAAAPASAAASANVTQPPAGAAEEKVSVETARPYRASAHDETMLRMKALTASSVLIASAVPESKWRIVNGAVEHTEDGGVTWQPQALGVDVPVRAGAAPAARVCWLAGDRGLVLLTTDGARWRRIAFPDTVDLVSILATDASHATVTTATGLRFSTADGGQTWTGR